MEWWLWIIVGVALACLEILFLDVAFYLIFIGGAAVLVGLIGAAGAPLPEWGQFLLFAALALTAMPLFRKRLYRKVRGRAPGHSDTLTGQTAEVTAAAAAHARGRGTVRGTDWILENRGAKDIPVGVTVNIVAQDGLVLIVEHAVT